MKKLLISIIVLCLLNLILLVLIYRDVRLDVDVFSLYNKCDTVINKVRIDSIEYIIKTKDSVINKIRQDEKRYSEQVNELSDTASVELFKRLVSD